MYLILYMKTFDGLNKLKLFSHIIRPIATIFWLESVTTASLGGFSFEMYIFSKFSKFSFIHFIFEIWTDRPCFISATNLEFAVKVYKWFKISVGQIHGSLFPWSIFSRFSTETELSVRNHFPQDNLSKEVRCAPTFNKFPKSLAKERIYVPFEQRTRISFSYTHLTLPTIYSV